MLKQLRTAQKIALALGFAVLIVQVCGFLATQQRFQSDVERLLSRVGARETAAFRHQVVRLGRRRGITLRTEDIRVLPASLKGMALVEVDYQLTFSLLFVDLPQRIHVSLLHEQRG